MLSFTAPAGDTVRSTITYVDGTSISTIAPTAWTDGKATAQITLKHGESVAFTNIPYGVTYTVTEVEANQDDYTTTTTYTDDTNKRIDSVSDEVTIVNHKGGDLTEGIDQDVLPYVGAGLLLGILGVITAIRRRKLSR